MDITITVIVVVTSVDVLTMRKFDSGKRCERLITKQLYNYITVSSTGGETLWLILFLSFVYDQKLKVSIKYL